MNASLTRRPRQCCCHSREGGNPDHSAAVLGYLLTGVAREHLYRMFSSACVARLGVSSPSNGPPYTKTACAARLHTLQVMKYSTFALRPALSRCGHFAAPWRRCDCPFAGSFIPWPVYHPPGWLDQLHRLPLTRAPMAQLHIAPPHPPAVLARNQHHLRPRQPIRDIPHQTKEQEASVPVSSV